MKIKNGLMMKKVGNEFVVMSIDTKLVNLNGMISLNESGAFLFEKLKEEIQEEDLLKVFLDEYEIDEATAKKDLETFINHLKENQLLEDE